MVVITIFWSWSFGEHNNIFDDDNDDVNDNNYDHDDDDDVNGNDFTLLWSLLLLRWHDHTPIQLCSLI